ncbi:MAG TPA: type 2 isopentenyl-diphosphate Delta-isomerase [Planctomycetota bacterium]|jgi:isopentenyl-diphosphate delta-isomerase
MIEARKADHLRICAEMDVEFEKTTLLEEVQFVHQAMSSLSLDAIDTTASFMGRKLRAPLIISAMSGGTAGAENLNRDLARAAQTAGVGFCLGSQRPMLEKPSLRGTYAVRRFAPDIPIIGNLGIQQAAIADTRAIVALVTSIEADGLAIHLNPAHEIRQEEGDRNFPSGLRALKTLAQRLPGKLVVKETGCGISRGVATELKKAGVRILDTAGAGGTSWPRVESLRRGVPESERSWLDEWGIPTAASILQVRDLGFALVGSGGIRSGLDVAKCIALGCDIAGMALPILRAYHSGGYDGTVAYLQQVIADLKSVMLLVGAKDIKTLKKHRPIITGALKAWQSPTPSK